LKARLRLANRDDILAVVAIESATFPCPWSAGTFYMELENDVSKFKVLTFGDEVIGYYDYTANLTAKKRYLHRKILEERGLELIRLWPLLARTR